jgi:hypothetical protein
MGHGLIGYEQDEIKPRDLENELAMASKRSLNSSMSYDSLELTLKHKSSLMELKLELEYSPKPIVELPSPYTSKDSVDHQKRLSDFKKKICEH